MTTKGLCEAKKAAIVEVPPPVFEPVIPEPPPEEPDSSLFEELEPAPELKAVVPVISDGIPPLDSDLTPDEQREFIKLLNDHLPLTGRAKNLAHLARMKRQIMGREVVVAITKGKLDLGPWEQIFYGEFDGRRKKRVLVKIIGD